MANEDGTGDHSNIPCALEGGLRKSEQFIIIHY